MKQQTTLKLGELIHYGSTVYDPSRVQAIRNREWVKPYGGLWTSPVDSRWGWREWCHAEEYRHCDIKKSFTVTLKDDARICIIDLLEDLDKLPCIKDPSRYGFIKYPDFEQLATMYDAIWLTERGQDETRHTHPKNLYGWDCESVLIMNADCIIETKTGKNENTTEKRTEMEGRHCVANGCGSACSCREDSSLGCHCDV